MTYWSEEIGPQLKTLVAIDDAKKLRVLAAAIKGDDGKVYSVPRPGRHHDVIQKMREEGYQGLVSGDRQGFLLSDGRFTWRKPALAVARRAGQLIREPTAPAHGLFSEDVW